MLDASNMPNQELGSVRPALRLLVWGFVTGNPRSSSLRGSEYILLAHHNTFKRTSFGSKFGNTSFFCMCLVRNRPFNGAKHVTY